MEIDSYLVFDLAYEEGFDGLHGLAILYVENGEIVDQYYKELADKYASLEDTEEIDLREDHRIIWSEIEHLVKKSNKMVCFRSGVHKTSFLETFGGWWNGLDKYEFIDISSTASNNIKECPGYSREALADFFGLEFESKNRTELSEAILSFEILQKILAWLGHDSLNGLLQERKQKKEDNAVSFFKSLYGEADMDGVKYWQGEFNKEDLVGKVFLVTGEFEKYPGKKRNELEKLLVEFGGTKKDSISKLLDFVIVGSGAGPKKLESVKKLQSEGQKLVVVSADMIESFI
ncbi:MAG: BRCT domain-containing protein [Leadbetterella sp.]|nr:BRCT domain-containing protein [Leadbetterella sp.]